MFLHEVIIAGFGGQGILSAGRLIAYAGMLDGREVSFLPSYGPKCAAERLTVWWLSRMNNSFTGT